jgi:hypothetical protein
MADKYKIDVIHSPDDGGYYADVWEAATGKDAHQTVVFGTPEDARDAAQRWVRRTPSTS